MAVDNQTLIRPLMKQAAEKPPRVQPRINPPGAIERVPNRREAPWEIRYDDLRDILIEKQLEVPVSQNWQCNGWNATQMTTMLRWRKPELQTGRIDELRPAVRRLLDRGAFVTRDFQKDFRYDRFRIRDIDLWRPPGQRQRFREGADRL